MVRNVCQDSIYTNSGFFSGSSICNSLSPSPVILQENVGRRTASSWLVYSKWVLTQKLNTAGKQTSFLQTNWIFQLSWKRLREYWLETSNSLKTTFHPKMILSIPSTSYLTSALCYSYLACSTTLPLIFSLTSKAKHTSIFKDAFQHPWLQKSWFQLQHCQKSTLERGERRKGFLTPAQPGVCQNTGQ